MRDGAACVGGKMTGRRAVLIDYANGVGSVRCEAVPVQDRRSGDVRVRVGYVGICGSDLEQLTGEVDPSFQVRYPHIVGHEWSGFVAEADEGSRLRSGDRVVGHGDLGGGRWLGVSSDGAMAEELVIPEETCFPVPDGVDLHEAALIEPFACCLQATRVAGGVDPSEIVMVSGCGAIGLAMVALTSAIGARVAAVDPSRLRRDLGRRLGAERVATPSDLEAAVGGMGSTSHTGEIDLWVETSGAPSAQQAALERTRPGGRVLLMGLGHHRADNVPLYRIQAKQLRLMASTGAPPGIWPYAITFVERMSPGLGRMATSVFPLEACVEAFAAAQDPAHHGKVLVTPSPELVP